MVLLFRQDLRYQDLQVRSIQELVFVDLSPVVFGITGRLLSTIHLNPIRSAFAFDGESDESILSEIQDRSCGSDVE